MRRGRRPARSVSSRGGLIQNGARGVQEEASMKGLKGVIVMVAALGLILVPARSQAFFDGFNGVACNPPGSPPCINFNNWHGDDTSEKGVSSTEVARGIKNGQLQLAFRTFGSTASNTSN